MTYMVVYHNCHDDPHAKGWHMAHATILGRLPPQRRAQVCRILALTLVPLLLVLWTGPRPDCLPAPVRLVLPSGVVRRRVRPAVPQRPHTYAAWVGRYAWRSGVPHLAQASGILLLLWGAGLPRPWLLLVGLPLLRWLLSVSALVWPAWGQGSCGRLLRQTLADLQIVLLFSLMLHLVGGATRTTIGGATAVVVTRRRSPKPTASGRLLDDGTYEVVLGEQFAIRHKPIDEFDRRMFLLFLRDIHLVDRPSKWPFVCQVWLAEWFGTLQELISRWEDYRAAGDWQRLMSRRDGPLMPLDQQQVIIQVWARHLWWSVDEVTAHLGDLGVDVCASRVEQVGRESGILLARRVLRERFHLGPALLRPKDDWLVQRLFAVIDQLQARLDAGAPLASQQTLDLADVQALRAELGLGSRRDLTKPLPWGYWLQVILCGDWAVVGDGSVRCPHCGTDHVRRKSRKGRTKPYYDAQGQRQTVQVFRYYCQNPACPYQTFTNLPPDLVPYSPWRMDVHVLALQAYELGRGSYRRVATALDVSVATSYRWVRQFGGHLLPVAALFGVVRSSGVVGVDEKWVQVPTNNKPAGKHRKWMYVYVAVDIYTYDLLHIAIFPHVGSDPARAFLLALQAKGYRPQVIVTDLNQDYGAAIAAVFPQAQHHECVFHALQAWHRQLREVYGKDYQERCPAALALQEQLDRIFQARTKRTAQRRYERVLALRAAYAAASPAVEAVFASLERHWPRLVNAIESERIPLTNNVTELVIRRFDQHYQNFCGFDTIETAQTYLAIFEWCYRFTPFTPDAQPRIRGKCPLELAGYDVSQLPMAQICRGQVLAWPPEALHGLVPRE
jgi:transposase-like protein